MERYNGEIEEELADENGEEVLIPKNQKRVVTKKFNLFSVENICMFFAFLTFCILISAAFFALFNSRATLTISRILTFGSMCCGVLSGVFFTVNAVRKKEMFFDIRFFCTLTAIAVCIF